MLCLIRLDAKWLHQDGNRHRDIEFWEDMNAYEHIYVFIYNTSQLLQVGALAIPPGPPTHLPPDPKASKADTAISIKSISYIEKTHAHYA